MKKQRIAALLVALALLLTMAACGAGEAKAPATSAPNLTAEDTPAPENNGADNEATQPEKITDASQIEWDSTPPESYDMSKQYPDAVPIKYASKTSSATFYAQHRGMDVADWYIIQQVPIRTDGRYRIDYYPDGQLASSADDHISGILTGAIDMCSLNVGSWGDFTDAFAEFNVPYAFSDIDIAHTVLNGQVGDTMAGLVEQDVGVKFCFYNTMGFRQFTNNVKEIASVEDFKGLKTRVQTDNFQIAAFKALGCAVSTLSYGELFSAIQQGVFEAEENPMSGVYSDSFYEVQNYLTLTNHIYSASAVVVNPSFWNSLSADDQAIFEQIFWEAQIIGEAATVENEDYFYEQLVEKEMTITELSDEAFAEIVEIMKETVWPDCEALMGADRWNGLQDAIGAA